MEQSIIPSQSKSNKTRVKVAIRVRPLLQRQMVGGYRTCTHIKSQQDIVIGQESLSSGDKNGPRQYKFDQVFKEDSPQDQVYVNCIRQLVLGCFDGYNAAVLAYGQTGSGKTYTMGTAVSTLLDKASMGIIPRVITQIFDQIDQKSNSTVITVTASYIELYNEQIIDLLADPHYKKAESITIKEDRETGLVNVEGVVKEIVASPGEMMRLLERGGMHRTTKQTNMNDMSSRSHAIFTMYIDSQPLKTDKDDKKEEALSGITHSRFFFADLAGSQRAKKTGATGDTLKEGININLGLLELGNVISALSTIEKNKDQFITFRNSKLTRILQDALGGNSNTYMIACVSPAQFNFEQSLNTLKYASKAMNIKNTPVINRNKNDMLKQQNQDLKAENRRLKKMLEQKGIRVDFEADDSSAMETKLLREENRTLNRRYNECLVELQTTKHKLNELEIKIYDIRREKDLMQLEFQELMRQNPQLSNGETINALRGRFQQNQRQKVQVLEKYLQQIQMLQTKIVDKDNSYAQLQAQYNSLFETSKKDEQILIKKHNMLYDIGRQNNKLKHQIARLMEGQVLKEHTQQHEPEDDYDEMEESVEEEDEQIQEHEQHLNEREKRTKDELQEVDKYILEKEQFLERISKEQMSLQTEVINSMKNQYHQKIALLEKEKRQLVKQKDQSGIVEKSKFVNKIQNLEGQLKEYRRKAKEQKNMERQVETQSSKIRDLAEEIKKFKMQKMELHRKLKQDKDQFEKLKSKRVKQLLQAKKQNMKKENEIKKIKIKTYRNEQTLKRKDDQIKRIKKVNEVLKVFVKPARTTKKERQNTAALSHEPTHDELKKFQKMQMDFVNKICRQITYEIDRQQAINTAQRQLEQAEKNSTELLKDLTMYRIKKERIDLKADTDDLTEQEINDCIQLGIIIRDLQERLEICESRITERQESDLLRQTINYFDIQSSVLFNKQYETIDALRTFVRAIMQALKNYIYENCHLLTQHKNDERSIERLKDRLKEERQNLLNLNAEYHRTVAQMREDSMNRLDRYYSQEPEPPSAGLKRMDERERKEMERKFQQLSRNNRHLTSELEKTRRKCEVVQEKYQNMRNLVSKDKNIGVGRQEEPSFVKVEKKLEKQASNKQLISELDGMLENIDRLKKVKSSSTFQEIPEQVGAEAETLNRWQCIWKVDAHTSGVSSIAVHSNFLISTATKSIRIWDLESHKMIAELQAPGAVKYVMIDPERHLFYTACDKTVTFWDLISLEGKTVLKSHRDEVRVIHGRGDYLFTGGKGTPNGGSLMIWDMRKLNPNQAMEEKQKNQDIFSITSAPNMLYYGTRNHSVRRMTINSWDVLSPFEPPHLDSVTGLSIVNGKLISGSKDKNLRLWDLDHPINNNKHTFHAFNDYVNTVQSPQSSPVFYAGSKDGQVKACYHKNDRIELIGSILAHTQSVNALATLDDNPFTILTASQDKVIKLWQPTKETLDNVTRQGFFQ